MEKIHIFHTNDIHSHLKSWPRTEALLRQSRATLEDEASTNYFSFDLGDAVDRWHPLAEATGGKAISKLLENAEYDAVTIGNNEGVGERKEELNSLYNNVKYDVLIANLIDKESKKRPEWAQPQKIYQTKHGRKIGVFGLTYPFEKSYSPLGWEILTPMETIQSILPTLEDCDLIILLSHLGIYFDREIAEKFPEINLIIGGHTHHVLPQGEWVDNTLITGAGRHGEYVGHIKIRLDDHAFDASANLFNLKNDVPYVPREEERVATYYNKGQAILDERKIAYLPKDFIKETNQHTNLVQLGLDAVADKGQTEAAILLTGLFVKNLKAGVVTHKNLHELLPHSMRLVRVTLKGKHLIELFEAIQEVEDFFKEERFVGVGFRGDRLEAFAYKGISFDTNGDLLWLEEKIEKNSEYSFTTVDFMLFSSFFPIISEEGKNEMLFPEFIRGVLGNYLKMKYPLEGGQTSYE